MFDVLRKVDGLQRLDETDFDASLLSINNTTVASVPGAQYAGLTITGGPDGVSTLAATHTYPALLDGVQAEFNEGPCLSAAWFQHTIHIDDLAADARWPHYRAAALARTPVRSILSFRLFGDGHVAGALNLYADNPGAFDDDSIELGLIFAAHTSVAWNSLRREQQFRSALASRDLIGQAKGMLMERFDIDAVAAFDLLRKLSQESNTRLVDIAERLLTSKAAERHRR
ncbi:hypothetical protein B1R94_20650 [Mycolicibacterium litorale]|nr:hypothetical protein B1R94_20650 [Mycolicibacterium litorale]